MTFWQLLWRKFCRHRLGLISLYILGAFIIVAIYAPLLASSKPLFVWYQGEPYFPLGRYLFYSGFYTKPLDLFFNLLMFTVPLAIILWMLFRSNPVARRIAVIGTCLLQIVLFAIVTLKSPIDPAAAMFSEQDHRSGVQNGFSPDWEAELDAMTPYAKLNLLLRYKERLQQHQRLNSYLESSDEQKAYKPATLWQVDIDHEKKEIANLKQILLSKAGNEAVLTSANAKIRYLEQRRQWLNNGISELHFVVMPLIRPFHWEDDAGGDQSLNRRIPWWELTRINQKDLVAALIFGTRISLVVGLLSVAIALVIALPIGAYAGYYGGKFDIVVCRLMEIWESMPTFFMLLMVVAISESKSVFLVIAIIGFFGWTGFSRYIRGEFFKQRYLPYVEACHAIGYSDRYIMFSHIMPNAVPPLLTLLPFAIMGAISSEAGLSFLGLGEEGSCSWGVLMDEGRNAFPAEAYLLWPPALLLTVLLIAIALVGDALRDALDPHHS